MSKARTDNVSIERLHELFTLDRNTGQLFWKRRTDCKKRTWNTKNAGKIAGSLGKRGYIEVDINGVRYKVHRIVWAMCNGRWPSNEIDHENKIRHDNTPPNLREATIAEQRQNISVSKNNTTGFIGVWRNANGKYYARIMVNYKLHSLGGYDTPEKAHEAYKEAKAKLHIFQPIVAQK